MTSKKLKSKKDKRQKIDLATCHLPLATFLIKLYKYLISPFLPASCRFLPTCSDYCTQAIEKHGFKGVILCVRRILRCRPGGGSGVDEVP